jgi:hypothetical protein
MGTCGLKGIFDAFAALLSPLIAVIVVYIAFRQWKTNQERERRESRKAKLDVYRRVKLLLRHVMWAQTLDQKLYSDFCDACAEADFLFLEELRSWLSHLQDVAANCMFLQECLDTAAPDADISTVEKKLDVDMSQLRSANDVLRDKFEHYL